MDSLCDRTCCIICIDIIRIKVCVKSDRKYDRKEVFFEKILQNLRINFLDITYISDIFALGKFLVALEKSTVLAADTTVALNGKIYGKPADEKEAFEFLKDFSGQTHEVLTAVCLVDKGGKPRETLTKTFVTFRPLTDEEINSYIASGDPFDKAGGYGIQGLAGQFVEKVEGSYSGVIGLPVDETKALLAEIGIRPH